MQVVAQHAFGGPEVLEMVERPQPQPLLTEVLVRVHATSVNPVELFVRGGQFPLLGQPPFTLGWDVSGVVEQSVSARFQPGDEVFGLPLFPRAAGAYGQYVAAPSRHFARKPSKLTHAQAAAVPLAGLTAYQALVDTAGTSPGQRVLIHGAGGGVGHLAVQIAKLRGAHVIATASAAKAAFVRGLGADEVIDYRATDFTTAVKDVDVVLELVARGYAQRSIGVLRPGGLLVTALEYRDAKLAQQVRAAGCRFAGVMVEPDAAALEQLARWLEAGQLHVHVSQVLPLRQAARAHELVASGATQGKVVLSVD